MFFKHSLYVQFCKLIFQAAKCMQARAYHSNDCIQLCVFPDWCTERSCEDFTQISGSSVCNSGTWHCPQGVRLCWTFTRFREFWSHIAVYTFGHNYRTNNVCGGACKLASRSLRNEEINCSCFRTTKVSKFFRNEYRTQTVKWQFWLSLFIKSQGIITLNQQATKAQFQQKDGRTISNQVYSLKLIWDDFIVDHINSSRYFQKSESDVYIGPLDAWRKQNKKAFQLRYNNHPHFR